MGSHQPIERCRDERSGPAPRSDGAALRDIDRDRLDAALARLPDDRSRRRARHVVTENTRVLEVAARLRGGEDPRQIGRALTESHASMRDDFEITVPSIDAAVERCLAEGAYGARMTGGGFGGCVIALVDAGAGDSVFTTVQADFARSGWATPARVPVRPADGAKRIG